jgi:hypothetical protein
MPIYRLVFEPQNHTTLGGVELTKLRGTDYPEDRNNQNLRVLNSDRSKAKEAILGWFLKLLSAPKGSKHGDFMHYLKEVPDI